MNTQELIAKIKQYPIVVGGVILSLILVGAYFTRSGGASALDAKINDMENQLKRFTVNFENSTNLEPQLEEMKTLSAELNERTMDGLQRGLNLDYFYQFERDSNLRIINVAQQEGADTTGETVGKPKLERFDSIGFIVTAEGKYEDLLSFLYELQHDQYFVRIDSFSAQMASDALQDNIRVELRLEILGKKQAS